MACRLRDRRRSIFDGDRLHEEGFLDRTRIYATDFNKHSLDRAQEGIYTAKTMNAAKANYLAAGGTGNSATTRTPVMIS